MNGLFGEILTWMYTAYKWISQAFCDMHTWRMFLQIRPKWQDVNLSSNSKMQGGGLSYSIEISGKGIRVICYIPQDEIKEVGFRFD